MLPCWLLPASAASLRRAMPPLSMLHLVQVKGPMGASLPLTHVLYLVADPTFSEYFPFHPPVRQLAEVWVAVAMGRQLYLPSRSDGKGISLFSPPAFEYNIP